MNWLYWLDLLFLLTLGAATGWLWYLARVADHE
jgi:hypothetical protein